MNHALCIVVIAMLLLVYNVQELNHHDITKKIMKQKSHRQKRVCKVRVRAMLRIKNL